MKYLILFIFLSVFYTGRAQDTIVSYFDSNLEEVKQEKANYYRKAFENTDKTWTASYYYMNGQTQMSGRYESNKLKKKNGFFETYYKDGSKQSEGQYLNNKFDGKWRWYHKNGQISSLEVYEKDELKHIEYWNEDGSKIEGKVEKVKLAEFVGGNYALQRYIASHVVYPRVALENGIVGKVNVGLIIGAYGEIERTWIVGYADRYLIDEALRVVSNMPKWIPGKVHNLPARVSYTVPINFDLR